MGIIRKKLYWGIVFSVLAMTVFMLACSNANPNFSPTLTSHPTESTPGPTIIETSPAIRTYQDLDSLKLEDPANIDNSRFPITPVSALRLAGGLPLLDMANYKLSVAGLVNTPLSLSYEAILKYPSISAVVLLICQGAFVDNAQWTGVPVSAFLADADLKPEASKVAFIAIDGYEIDLNLEDVRKDGVFLAYKVNGEILPKEQGYPVRLVVKGQYGAYWVKWVNQLEVK